MSTSLNQMQVDKFKALGKASRKLSEEYKNGEGPDPTSGSTFKGGVPQCTWGQLLYEAGFKPGSNYSTGDNSGAFADFIGYNRNLSQPKLTAHEEGLFEDKNTDVNLEKILAIGRNIMNNNDPQTTAEGRKKATWKLLEQLADEIDNTFGEVSDDFITFETAAEQYLDELVLGELKIEIGID
jgi:hypothetical protein